MDILNSLFLQKHPKPEILLNLVYLQVKHLFYPKATKCTIPEYKWGKLRVWWRLPVWPTAAADRGKRHIAACVAFSSQTSGKTTRRCTQQVCWGGGNGNTSLAEDATLTVSQSRRRGRSSVICLSGWRDEGEAPAWPQRAALQPQCFVLKVIGPICQRKSLLPHISLPS